MDWLPVLGQLFSQKLPGWDAHKHMCPPYRNEQLELFASYRHKASVGIILTAKNNELYVIFIERTNDGKAHSGQIAFPGGKIDFNDTSALETAYREVFEEIGIDKQHLLFIREITSLYIPVSQFLVYPFVFFCQQLPNLLVNPHEIQHIYIYPVQAFYRPEVCTFTTLLFNDKPYTVPCFKIENIIIWGATAMIWNECLTLIKPLYYHE